MDINNKEVKKDIEEVRLPEDDSDDGLEEVEDETDTQPDSSTDENQDDAEDKPDTPEKKEEVPPVEDKPLADGIVETPRERALRLENERLRGLTSRKRTTDLLGDDLPKAVKKEIPAEKKEILKKYKPEEIESLKEIVDVLAEDMGFVRKDEFTQTTYQQQASSVLDAFLDSHPEYTPEKDKDNTLWSRFEEEFKMYKRPENPKDLVRIFNRIHTDIFGITKPNADLNKVKAQKEKIKVASHSGKSSSGKPQTRTRSAGSVSDLRGHLKGFSDDELNELLGE